MDISRFEKYIDTKNIVAYADSKVRLTPVSPPTRASNGAKYSIKERLPTALTLVDMTKRLKALSTDI